MPWLLPAAALAGVAVVLAWAVSRGDDTGSKKQQQTVSDSSGLLANAPRGSLIVPKAAVEPLKHIDPRFFSAAVTGTRGIQICVPWARDGGKWPLWRWRASGRLAQASGGLFDGDTTVLTTSIIESRYTIPSEAPTWPNGFRGGQGIPPYPGPHRMRDVVSYANPQSRPRIDQRTGKPIDVKSNVDPAGWNSENVRLAGYYGTVRQQLESIGGVPALDSASIGLYCFPPAHWESASHQRAWLEVVQQWWANPDHVGPGVLELWGYAPKVFQPWQKIVQKQAFRDGRSLFKKGLGGDFPHLGHRLPTMLPYTITCWMLSAMQIIPNVEGPGKVIDYKAGQTGLGSFWEGLGASVVRMAKTHGKALVLSAKKKKLGPLVKSMVRDGASNAIDGLRAHEAFSFGFAEGYEPAWIMPEDIGSLGKAWPGPWKPYSHQIDGRYRPVAVSDNLVHGHKGDTRSTAEKIGSALHL